MINKIILVIFLAATVFPLGKMPKAWKMPDAVEQTQELFVGKWQIDGDKAADIYRRTDDYLNTDENYREMAVDMIVNILSTINFELNKNGTYTIYGLPTASGTTDNVQGIWYKKENNIILESPKIDNQQTEEEDLTFQIIDNNTLFPINRNAEMFNLLRVR